MKIVGLIKVDKGLPLAASCLNRRINIKISSFNGILLTPILPTDFNKNRENFDKRLEQPESIINFNDTVDWGRPVSWPSGESDVTTFKIEIDIESKENIDLVKKTLSIETEKWIGRFLNNLFAIGYNYDRVGYQSSNRYRNDFDYYVKNKEKGKPENFKFSEGETIIVNISTYEIDFNNFQIVLDATSNNKTLKQEYKLLKASDKALYEKEYRKSILDSATALEICLTNILKENLIIENEKLLKEILNANNSITKKRKLLKFTEFELPDFNFQKDVEELRNKTIHAGFLPSQEEVKNAYEIVSETVELLIENKFEL